MIAKFFLSHFLINTAAMMLVLLIACTGCGSSTPEGGDQSASSGSEPQDEPQQDGMTAAKMMEKMVAVYREADIYFDNAEYGEHFVFAGEGIQRQGLPVKVSVLFKRPNQFRITRLNGPAEAAVVACDGQKLEAMVVQLEPQRLSVPAPKVATAESVTPDPLLRKALFPVPMQDVFPQLALLLATDDETPWPLAGREGLLLLPPKAIHSRGSQPLVCYRVQMQTTMGPQICWIDKTTFLLLRIEMSNEELRKKVYPDHEFSDFSWRFDFYDATLNAQMPTKTFQLEESRDADSDGDETADTEIELVSEFHAVATTIADAESEEEASGEPQEDSQGDTNANDADVADGNNE